jgi:hypothetical protein
MARKQLKVKSLTKSGASARKLILGIATDTDITKLRTDLKAVIETESIIGGVKVNDLPTNPAFINILK